MIKHFLIVGIVSAVLASCGGGETKKEDTPLNVEVKSVGELTIGYYEQDSIAVQFDFYKNTQKSLEDKKKKIDAKIAIQQKAYESAAIALQSGMQNNVLSQNQAEAYQMKMARAEQEVMQIQQNEMVPFEEESFKANEVLMNKIDSYSKEFAKKHKLKLFLVRAKGGQIGYVDTEFDKTKEFIEFMNKKEKELEEDAK